MLGAGQDVAIGQGQGTTDREDRAGREGVVDPTPVERDVVQGVAAADRLGTAEDDEKGAVPLLRS